MNIQLVSDLHLEFGDLTLPGGETLVIAGDLAEVRSFHQNHDGYSRKQTKRLWRFLEEELPKYEDVIYVTGNHEYYGRSIEGAHELIRLNWPKKIHWLNGASLSLKGVQFFGTTLWTDMNKDNPVTHIHLQHAMSDFSIIDDFSTHRAYVLHQEQKAKLLAFLESAKDDKVVIITHHAPSEKSVPKRYERDFHMNGGYWSDLEYIMYDNPNIITWMHGHMHESRDYYVYDTRVLCNPRGYYGHEAISENFMPVELEV